MSDLKTMIGQMVFGGFDGTELNDDFRQLVRDTRLGNVILYKHNIVDREQLAKLCGDIRSFIFEETGHVPFIATDQEGGVISRLPSDMINPPAQMAVAQSCTPEEAGRVAAIAGRELKSVGINFNFAPVLDVNSNPHNPIIGSRSFSDKTAQVTEYGLAMIRGYLSAGIMCCGKHFPGHGDTSLDTHFELPSENKTLQELEDIELVPFKAAIDIGIPAIMSSHILFPMIETAKIPCTMSRIIITDILKKQLGFNGLAVSDCLEMGAISRFYGAARGAISAVSAGINMLCISHSAQLIRECTAAIAEAVEDGRLDRQLVADSCKKIYEYKQQISPENSPEDSSEVKYAPASDGDREWISEIRRRSVKLFCGSIKPAGTGTLFVGCEDFRADLLTSEPVGTNCPKYLAERFGGSCIVTTADPGKDEIENVTAAAIKAENIVLITYNGHIFEGQMNLLRALQGLKKPLTVAAMRDPYDLLALEEPSTGIIAWEYTAASIKLVGDLLSEQEGGCDK